MNKTHQESLLFGDGDEWELESTIKDVFNVTLTIEDWNKIQTVGDLILLLQTRYNKVEWGGNCSSSMIFFRIRKWLKSISPEIKLHLDTPLSSFYAGNANKFLNELKRHTGFSNDLDINPMFNNIFIVYVGIFFACISFLFFDHNYVHLFGIITLLLSVLAFYIKPKWPEEVTTMAGLVKHLESQNYGQLTLEGGKHNPENLKEALIEVLADMTFRDKNKITEKMKIF